VTAVIGDKYQLTMEQEIRLNMVFDVYGSPKKCENWLSALAFMIKYNLTNYIGRIRRLKELPASPSKYSLMLRYGRNWHTHYTIIVENRTLHFDNRLVSWISKGYTQPEAVQLVKEVQTKRSSKSPAAQKGASEYSSRCVGFWIKQGYTEEESKTAVSKTQSHPRSKEVIDKWLATLSAKSEDEKKLINLKKGHSIEAFLLRGHSEKSAEELSRKYYEKRNNYSLASQSFFTLLESLIGHDLIYYKTKNYEKQIGVFCVDFYDVTTKTVVEYYGDFWHRNPKKYKAEFVAYNQTSKFVWKRDQNRIEKISRHPDVKRVIIVWESDVAANPHRKALEIIQEIKNGN
jgi:very-short-patch-repair endonuclease